MGADTPLTRPAAPDRITDRYFRRAARRDHLKRCPNCATPIQKNGGCDHMACPCGTHFSWSQAQTVVPCRQLHLKPGGFRLWCTTCPGCSKIATAKLGAARAGIVVATPCVTAATATVPAVVCAPLAAAYEPVRRLRGRPSNRFARGMGSGVRLVKHAVVAMIDSDSD